MGVYVGCKEIQKVAKVCIALVFSIYVLFGTVLLHIYFGSRLQWHMILKKEYLHPTIFRHVPVYYISTLTVLHLLPREFVRVMSTVVRTLTATALGFADFEYQYYLERKIIPICWCEL